MFNYKTDRYGGELISNTDEGNVFWTDVSNLETLKLSDGFKERLPMFFDAKYSEGFGVWSENYTGQMKWI